MLGLLAAHDGRELALPLTQKTVRIQDAQENSDCFPQLHPPHPNPFAMLGPKGYPKDWGLPVSSKPPTNEDSQPLKWTRSLSSCITVLPVPLHRKNREEKKNQKPFPHNHLVETESVVNPDLTVVAF